MLLLADPLGMKIYALDAKQNIAAIADNLEVANIDEKLVALLGVGTKEIRVADMR